MEIIQKGIAGMEKKSAMYINAPTDVRLIRTVVCPDGCVIFKLTAKPLGNENFHTGGFWDYPDETQIQSGE